MENNFHGELRKKMNTCVHLVYALTRKFPREELYGATSQLRRAILSVILNYIEGYARGRDKVHKNFLEISYGSLQEAKYLLSFALEEGYILREEYENVLIFVDDIGGMLWGILRRMP